MHCPACSSESLTPPASVSQVSLTWRIRDDDKPGKSPMATGFKVRFVRVCADCGYVLWFLDEKSRARLAESLPMLEPFE